MKRLLYILVTMFAILLISHGIQMYEAEHNRKLGWLIPYVEGLPPDRTLTFQVLASSKENGFKELQQITDTVRGDLLLRVVIPPEEEENPTSLLLQAKSKLHYYVYSDDPHFIPKNFVSDSSVDWSAGGQRGYTWPHTENHGNVLQLTDRLPGFTKNDQIVFFPLSKAEEVYTFTGGQLITGFLHADDLERGQDLLASVETVAIQDIDLLASRHAMDYAFAPFLHGEPYGMVFYFLLTLFGMILTIYTFNTISLSKEIGIRKMLGQSTQYIAHKHITPLNMLLSLLFIGALSISALFFIRHWNSLTFSFLLWPLISTLVFLGILFIASAMNHRYIWKLRPGIDLKRSPSVRVFYTAGILHKGVLLVLAGSLLLSFIPQSMKLYHLQKSRKIYPQKYITLELLMDNIPIASVSEKMQITYELLQKYDSIITQMDGLAAVTMQEGSLMGEGFTDTGAPILKELTTGAALTTWPTLEQNDIRDLLGKRIQLSEPPDKTLILVPEGKNLNEIHPFFLLDLPTIDHEIISIQSNQSVLFFNGEMMTDAVLLILGKSEYDWTTIYVPDTTHNRNTIHQALLSEGYPSSWYEILSITSSVTAPQFMPDYYRTAVLLAFLSISFLLLSVHNASLFVWSRHEYFNLRYLHGVPALRRYKSALFQLVLPYAITLASIRLFPANFIQLGTIRTGMSPVAEIQPDYPTLFCIFLSIFAFDFVFHFFLLTKIQKDSITLLKGERK